MKFADVHEFEPQAHVQKVGAAICLADSIEQQHVLTAVSEMKISTTIFNAEAKELQRLKTFEFIVADQLVAPSSPLSSRGKELKSS